MHASKLVSFRSPHIGIMRTHKIFHINFAVALFFMAIALLPTVSYAERPTSDWRSDAVCGRKLAGFESANVEGCADAAYCAAVDKDTRICACQNADQAESANTDVTLEYKGKIQKKWTTEISSMSYGPASFRLDEFGLNQSGKREILFAVMASQSNGMGVQNWSVWSIGDGQVSAPISMHDYGLMGFATRAKGSRSCQLLVSHWDQGRKDGLYVVGRWHNVVQGKFMPIAGRPAVSSRYLFRLEKRRLANMNSGKPLRWYASEDASPVR